MSKWIKVSSRLPEPFVEVIVSGLSCENQPIVSCGWVAGNYSDNQWHVYSADLDHSAVLNEPKVTHWMPLPEPPKERANAANE